MTTTQTSTRNSLPSLWEQAVEFWKELILGYGRPKDLMRWGRMRALYHRSVGHCLREIETLIRRAIRTDAEDLDLPPLKPLPKRPQQQPRSHTPRAPDPEDPTTWKVTFRMTPRACDPERERYTRNPPNPDPEALRPCRGYAFRMEAVRRAIKQRDIYVKRHARRLARIEHARLEVMANFIAESQAASRNREALLSELSALLGPPEDEGDGLMTFNVQPSNAKHVEPG
jgi:hypothetical protein